MIRHLIFFLSIFYMSSLAFSQAYKIQLNIKDVKDTTVVLAHHFADKHFIVDTTEINHKGVAIFKGNKELQGGLYTLILPNNVVFDIIIADDQKFTLEFDTTDVVGTMKVNGDIENKLFYESQQYLTTKRKTYENLKKNFEDSTLSSTAREGYKKQMDEMDALLSGQWKEIVKEHPNTFYAHLLNAMNGDEGEFFDNVDFSDERLLNSNVIFTVTRRVMARDLNAKKPTSVIISNTDKLLEKAQQNDKVYRYVLSYLISFYHSYQRLGINYVFSHIAEKYVLSGDAPWLDSVAVQQIKKTAEMLTAAEVGKIAPDIKLERIEGDSIALHDLKSKYTLLFFWKTGCGHCEDAAKKINEFYNPETMDLEVFAVFTNDNRHSWEDFIKNNKLENWIHVYDKKMNSNYGAYYFVVSTPLCLLLDKDKKIVAQKAGDTNIADLIEQLKTQKEKFAK